MCPQVVHDPSSFVESTAMAGLTLPIESIFRPQAFQAFRVDEHINYAIFNRERPPNGQNDRFPPMVQHNAIWRLSIRAVELSIYQVGIFKACVRQQRSSMNMATVVADYTPVVHRAAIVAVLFVLVVDVFVVKQPGIGRGDNCRIMLLLGSPPSMRRPCR